MVDQPTAEQRSERRGDGGRRRPNPDRPPALVFGKMRSNQRQGSRHHQRAAETLSGAGENQFRRTRRERAGQRRRREKRDAERIDPPQTITVARRAAEQQKGGKHQRIAVGDPLHFRQRRVERDAHPRNGDRDDAAVGERHPRADDRRGQHAALQRRHGGDRGQRRRRGVMATTRCSINRRLEVANTRR